MALGVGLCLAVWPAGMDLITAVGAEPAKKLAEPESAAQNKALAFVASVFKSDYETAKSPEQKVALAKKMLEVGRNTNNDVAARFVLFRVARDVAAQAGDLETSLEAIDQMAAEYDVDKLALQVAAARTAQPALRTAKEQQQAATLIGPVINAALAADRYDLAKESLGIATRCARDARDTEQVKVLVAKLGEVDDIAKAFAEIAPVIERLKEMPNDPVANGAAGRYYCLVRDNWPRGLPLLAAGDDPALKELSRQELGEKPDPLKLADAWWSYAELQPEPARKNIRNHAARWYARALPKLAGLERVRVEQRLEEVPAEVVIAARQPDDSPTGKAITAGLDWLAKQQQADGSWTMQTAPNPGRYNSDVAATAMALIPMLRAGSTHQAGPYAPQIKKGLGYLLAQTRPNGDLRGNGGNMYVHGLGATAVVEAYARSKDRRLQTPAQAVINFIVAAQDPQQGGWRYAPVQRGDTSVFGWQVAPLMIAHSAKLQVPQQTLAGASTFLDLVEADGGSKYGYTSPGMGTNTSVIGLLGRLQLGGNKEDDAIQRGLASVANRGPARLDSYFNYYATQLMHRGGGDSWIAWEKKLSEQLLELQSKDPAAPGSWFEGAASSDMVASNAGRLGVTSLTLLALQVGR